MSCAWSTLRLLIPTLSPPSTRTLRHLVPACPDPDPQCAGLIGSATYGVATNVSLVSVRVVNCLGVANWDDIVKGVEWVINDDRVGVGKGGRSLVARARHPPSWTCVHPPPKHTLRRAAHSAECCTETAPKCHRRLTTAAAFIMRGRWRTRAR
jgi:hypothetical protein